MLPGASPSLYHFGASSNYPVMYAASSKRDAKAPVVYAYLAFSLVALYVFHHVAEGEWSSILTLAALLQCLGVAMLCMQVLTYKSAEGISAGGLMLDGMAFALRLSSTTWLDGYLPADASGDYVYQLLDICSLLMILFLLRQVLVVKRTTYDEAADTFTIAPVVLVSLALATILHADLNENPLFDTLWTTSLFIGSVSVLPQLFMTMKTGGCAKALTSHYIMALALSRVLSGMYMWVAKDDITPPSFIIQDFNHASWAILFAHVLHFLLLGDFTYYYVRSCMRNGFGRPVELGNSGFVI